MQKLKAYLNSMSPVDQLEYARRCETSVGYLRKVISTGQKIGEGLCIKLERESARQVLCEDLREDVDWAFLRGTPGVEASAKRCAAVPAVARAVVKAGEGRAVAAGGERRRTRGQP